MFQNRLFELCKVITIVLVFTVVLVPVVAGGQKTKLKGRVLAVSSWPVAGLVILRNSPRTQEFVFGVESKDPHGNETIMPVYVSYEYYPDSDDKFLQIDFFDYSKKYELSVVRTQGIGRDNEKENLNYTFEEVSYVKVNIYDENNNFLGTSIDKRFPPRLEILDGVPETVLSMDMDMDTVLPRYELPKIKYKIIKEKSKK